MGELRYVLGCISQLQDGRFFLEDLSDAIPLDLSATNTASGFFTGAPTGTMQDPADAERWCWACKLASVFVV